MKKLLIWVGVLAVVVLGGWSIYLMGPWSTATDAAGVPAPPGWVSHRDPKGFSVAIPKGWKVEADASNGRINITGTGEEQVVIWPVFIPASLNSTSAGAVLSRLTAQVWPEAQWESPQGFAAGVVRRRGMWLNRQAASILTWSNSPKGSAAFLYALAAPSNGYAERENTFAQILSSFHVTGAAAGPASQTPAVQYTRWQDPRENAFSFEIPEQWKVTGGLFRFAPVDTRPAFVALSPDGAIRITGGDSQIPTFTEPSPILQMAGFYEGSWYSPGYGVRMLVRRFTPPVDFLKNYIPSAIARGCAGLSFSNDRNRPDAVEAINAINARYNNSAVAATHYAGETAFSCQMNGEPMVGYYFVEQVRAQMQGGALWNVEYLYGYMAPQSKQETAQSTLEHLLASFQLNPQWAAMQQNITANTSQIVTQTNEKISSMIMESFEYRNRVNDELSRKWENAILGVEDVIDPLSGRQFKVESGSNYQWIDNRGYVVGTQTDTRPGFDFRKLVRLP